MNSPFMKFSIKFSNCEQVESLFLFLWVRQHHCVFRQHLSKPSTSLSYGETVHRERGIKLDLEPLGTT